MQSYYVYALGQLCDERRDDLARAYRQPPRAGSKRDDVRRSRRRLANRMRDVRRAAASGA